MKQFLLLIAITATITCTAQTKPPTMAKLIQLYTDTNMAAINNYAHQLGFKGDPFGYNNVGNTYDYMHYSFVAKDTVTKQHTYLSYIWGQHNIYMPYTLTQIAYGTNSQAEFDALISELKALDFIIEEAKNDVLPDEHIYRYNGIYIKTYMSDLPTTAKHAITIGGRYF